ncbi:hypothetical protein SAMN04489806_1742 [Paramicrobacterium humi]|uniref:Squalene cyclase n=1 Tax=Paramicrobacterium humi TaxID=640635 RepID=A0A1H4M351_9MICO|nr:hypothetical protein [Microbacterium humi]SEB77459.1 hypothetical protein SAMN04489806_1742 [Microbacterium humi]
MTVVDWLLDSDPAIRWQVLRDLLHAPGDQVDAERDRVAHAGWGARLLDLQDADGHWSGGTHFPAENHTPGFQPWTATSFTLQQLRQFGVRPADARVRRAIAKVRDNVRWEYDDLPFFDGEVEPCINGLATAVGAYFGEDVRSIVARLLADQLDDGGWNCEAERGSTRSSFNSTIAVLEGLLEFEQTRGPDPAVTSARERAHEYLLERRLMRRLSTGEVPVPAWLQFSYPTRWHYDVLRALDYFRTAEVPRDDRMGEALELVESKRQPDGRWLLENTHHGDVHFAMEEGDGMPSRWNTLRATRVLEWFNDDVPVP